MTTEIPEDDPLLVEAEVSTRTRLARGTLRYYRHQGTGPEWFKVGRRVVYRKSKVDAWIDAQEAASA